MDKVTEDQILKEGAREFEQNRIDAGDEAGAAGPAPSGAGPVKPRAQLSDVAVGLIVRVKNRVAINLLTKDLDQDRRRLVEGVYATKAEEIKAYRAALEDTFNQHASPEFIELLNKYCGSALIAVVEIEVERFFMLRSQLVLPRPDAGQAQGEATKAA